LSPSVKKAHQEALDEKKERLQVLKNQKISVIKNPSKAVRNKLEKVKIEHEIQYHKKRL